LPLARGFQWLKSVEEVCNLDREAAFAVRSVLI
jgi:hypothetical protein